MCCTHVRAVRTTQDWKYIIALEDTAEEKGLIESTSRALSDFTDAHGIPPLPMPGGNDTEHDAERLDALRREYAQVVGDKAIAIASSLVKRKYFLPACRELRRAAAKAPTHPQLLAMYAGMLNFNVFERDEGRRVLQQALEVAPADAHVLVEHAKYLAFREFNPSAAIDQLRHALQVDGV